jgi:hypothetical protein
MTKSELESILKRARPPEISEESLSMFPRRVVARLQRQDQPARAARHFSPRFAWGLGLAACIVLVLPIVRWHGSVERKTIPSGDILANTKMVHEMLAMFPNRVRAIVEDARGVSLVLSESEDVPASQPLYVHLCDGRNCSSFVTFSGQEIQVAGQKVTTLSDAHGGIILTGNQFVWSSAERMETGRRLQIEAKNLDSAAM